MDRREYEQMLETQGLYEAILARTEIALFDWDVLNDEIKLSDPCAGAFAALPSPGKIRQALEQKRFFCPEDIPVLQEKLTGLVNGSEQETVRIRMPGPDGRYFWCRIRGIAVRGADGNLCRVIGSIVSIDQEQQAQLRLQERADRDSLTNLLNSAAAEQQTEEFLSRNSRGALLLIDLDHFKEINDCCGHLCGDQVLIRVAREIQKLFRTGDLVARVGGDEFLVFMKGVSCGGPVEERCKTLQQALRNVMTESQRDLGCSVGIAMSPDHGSTYRQLFQKADAALYAAKKAGRDCCRFWNGDQDIQGNRH